MIVIYKLIIANICQWFIVLQDKLTYDEKVFFVDLGDTKVDVWSTVTTSVMCGCSEVSELVQALEVLRLNPLPISIDTTIRSIIFFFGP